MLCQNATTTSLNIIVPSTTSGASAPTASPTNSNSTDTGGGDNSNVTPCTPGNSVGYMIIRQPNITSMVTVGQMYNVSWDWSIAVTKPPSYVDVYVQMIASGVQVTWKNKVASRMPVEPRWFLIKLDGLFDGKYKLRLVGDSKETFNVPANQLPCFENGESIPSVSAAFSVVNSKGDLTPGTDMFPPNSKASRMIVGSSFISIGIISMFTVFYAFVVM